MGARGFFSRRRSNSTFLWSVNNPLLFIYFSPYYLNLMHFIHLFASNMGFRGTSPSGTITLEFEPYAIAPSLDRDSRVFCSSLLLRALVDQASRFVTGASVARGRLMVSMIPQISGFDRKFVFNQPVCIFPLVLERLRGTPVRAKELVAGRSENVLALRVNNKWSAKEHPGHLADLQSLDDQRLTEFLQNAAALSAADPKNRATELSDHRAVPIVKTLKRLWDGREQLVIRLEVLSEEDVARVALHPRLQQPMGLVDWLYFLAEHDDHHLALARSAISASRLNDCERENK